MSLFYFIILIIQCYILTPVIQEVNKKFWGVYAIIITLIGISFFDYYMRIEGLKLSLVQSASPFPVWVLFYVMGVLKAQGLEFPCKTINPVIEIAVGIVLCCIHIAWLFYNYGCIVPGIKLSSHIYTYFVIIWLFSDAAREAYNKVCSSKVSKWIVDVGRLSFYIYLSHCLIIYLLCFIRIPVLWSLRWLICIILSYLFAKLSNKYCPIELKRYIGL